MQEGGRSAGSRQQFRHHTKDNGGGNEARGFEQPWLRVSGTVDLCSIIGSFDVQRTRQKTTAVENKTRWMFSLFISRLAYQDHERATCSAYTNNNFILQGGDFWGFLLCRHWFLTLQWRIHGHKILEEPDATTSGKKSDCWTLSYLLETQMQSELKVDRRTSGSGGPSGPSRHHGS